MKLLRILRWLVLLLSVLLAVQLLARCHARQRGELGELYERYCEQPGVRVALVQNMPINDTLSKDILLLTATDSAGWAWIVKEIGGYEKNAPLRKATSNSIWLMSSHIGTKENPGKKPPRPPHGTTYYDQLEQGVYDELLEVCVIVNSHSALIATITTRQEGRAWADLMTDRSTSNYIP